MAIIDAFASEPYVRGRQVYVRAPQPIEFPSEEGPEERVSETKRHLEARTTLYLLLKEAFAGMAIGSEQFVYTDAGDPKKCLSPDVFVKGDSTDQVFETWKIWERGAPSLAVEIVSASDRRDADWNEKYARYQASGIAEVVRFDPDGAPSLRVWDRVDGDLVERAKDSPALRECVTLRLWWAIVPSDYGPMLRLARDREGNDLLPTANEERLRLAEELAEARRARSLAEHARLLAEHERLLAQHNLQAEAAARAAADAARAAADEARAAADEARAAAETENEQLRAELARLRAAR